MLQSIIGIPKILKGPIDTFDFHMFIFLLSITADYESPVIDFFRTTFLFEIRYI
jgi:hypothetical protein